MKMILYFRANVTHFLKKDFELARFESEGFGTRNGQLKFVFPTVGKIILKYWLRLYVNDFLNTEHKDRLTTVVIISFNTLVTTVVN